MTADHVDALVATTDDGIAFDGLRVESTDAGYTFETGGEERTGLDVSALREAALGSNHVSNWYVWHAVAPQKPDRWAFLRWLEGADEMGVDERYDALAEGMTTEWGQLRITATLDEDGERAYEVRHVDDAGAADLELDTYDDPLDARGLATHDERGRYRPLKAAPTLQSGWRFAHLDPTALVETVETFYPASVPNWHREREGDLDVSHWRETMERQTGMYGVVKTWDRGDGYEHVNWVAEATCDDSQCLKRREWEYDADTDLDVDGGDGEFPCREPCSVVVSAARQWTKLESEEPRTYEFELTPSEKEQVEEIIDAVADGRVDDIREADVYDGANRFRARFLRAKLFDDAGNLAGTPTDREE
ncbi:DR2241 family protein [Salinigranum sp.]|uniref:DR2241 family protein n=1 Tax=Salinigranum sp. TaxID=1966351 RepID=UPI003564ADB0